MRSLSPPPLSIVDPATGAPRFGAYRGGLPRVDLRPLGKGPLFRIAHEKRWVYVAIASGDLLIGLAIVRLGYVANTFVFVYDRKVKSVVIDRSALAPPFAASVSDFCREGCRAVFSFAGMSLRVERGAGEDAYRVEVIAEGLRLDARLSAVGAPDPMGIVAEIPGGLVDVTEKGVLLGVTGEVTIAGKTRSLDGGTGGYDYTQGYLARHTHWRWAFALGKTAAGERFALNMAQSAPLAPECTAWIGDELFPLSEGKFAFDEGRPLGPWRLTTDDGAVDLAFSPDGLHAEFTDLVIVKSRFIQPAGTFSGTLRLPGKGEVAIRDVLGVVEDQDVLW